VIDGRGEEALETDVSCDVSNREDDEDDDVQYKYRDTKSLKPAGIVRQIIQQYRCDTGAL
jgi:hypothetical protein